MCKAVFKFALVRAIKELAKAKSPKLVLDTYLKKKGYPNKLIVILQEIIHITKRLKERKGIMVVKVDVEKAYDHDLKTRPERSSPF